MPRFPLHAVKAYRQAKKKEVGEEEANRLAEAYAAALEEKLKDLGARPDWPRPPRP